jgi:hypothetical protein
VKLPFVSRDRYDEAVAREARLQARIEDLEGKIMAMIDKMVALKPPPPVAPEDRASFALPPVVAEAIAQRAVPGTQTERLLRRHAEKRLANGNTEVTDVVQEILAGSDAFTEDEW